MKRPSILLAVVLVATSLSAACGREGPLPPPDTTPPQVTSTIPANGSVDVPISQSDGITILFSEKMDASTINDQTITLAVGENSVPGSITYKDSAGVSAAVFTPLSILNPTTLYKITVDIGVKDSQGNPMAAPYLSSFSTGTAPGATPPSVVATTPGNGNVNIQPNAPISITFSTPVDPATILFTLSAGGATVPCTMSYSNATAVFTPSSSLAYRTQYTATVSAGVRDLAGTAMPNDYFWSFSTIAASDNIRPVVTATTPAAGATQVAVEITPSVTFSEPVDPTTIAFTLISAGSVTVSVTTSYSGATVLFTPSSVLKKDTRYTARVSAGVRDLVGNAMLTDYSWNFTTRK